MGVVSRVYVGVDVGERRIGLARSDALGLLASPAGTLRRTVHSADIESILHFASESGALEIVVGMPISMSGDEGPQARRTAEFARSLAAQSHVPVRLQDERLSTVEAEAKLRAAGRRPSMDREAVDSAAAAVILQRYLDGLDARAARSPGAPGL